MKVKFKDGTEKNCTAPIEQKVFRNSEAAGWILMFSLTGEISSAELDAFLNTDNIGTLKFISDNPTYAEDENVFASVDITGYEKISSSVIRYAEDVDNSRTEIQLTKGL